MGLVKFEQDSKANAWVLKSLQGWHFLGMNNLLHSQAVIHLFIVLQGDLWINEGSQRAIHEHGCMIYLAGSRNRKMRRMEKSQMGQE